MSAGRHIAKYLQYQHNAASEYRRIVPQGFVPVQHIADSGQHQDYGEICKNVFIHACKDEADRREKAGNHITEIMDYAGNFLYPFLSK